MLPYTDEKEEWQREQDSSYRNPCYTKTDQEVYELEDCKHGYVFKWYWLHKGSMNSFQDPAMISTIGIRKIVGSQYLYYKIKWNLQQGDVRNLMFLFLILGIQYFTAVQESVKSLAAMSQTYMPIGWRNNFYQSSFENTWLSACSFHPVRGQLGINNHH